MDIYQLSPTAQLVILDNVRECSHCKHMCLMFIIDGYSMRCAACDSQIQAEIRRLRIRPSST